MRDPASEAGRGENTQVLTSETRGTGTLSWGNWGSARAVSGKGNWSTPSVGAFCGGHVGGQVGGGYGIGIGFAERMNLEPEPSGKWMVLASARPWGPRGV